MARSGVEIYLFLALAFISSTNEIFACPSCRQLENRLQAGGIEEGKLSKSTLKEALKQSSDITTSNPNCAEALVVKAGILMALGKLSSARACLDRAQVLNPRLAALWYQRALIASIERRPDKMLEYINRAIAADPGNSKYFLCRAQANYLLWHFQGVKGKDGVRLALADLDKAIALDPRCAKAYRYKGIWQLGKRDHKSAIASFNKGIALEPQNWELFQYRALAYQEAGNKELALKDLDKVILLNPGRCASWERRANFYLQHGKPELAVKDFSKALEIKPSNFRLCYRRAEAYISMNKLDDAIKDYQTIARANPFDDEVYARMADLQSKKGNFKESLRLYNEAIDMQPDAMRYFLERKKIYEKLGMREEARKDEIRARELESRPAEKKI